MAQDGFMWIPLCIGVMTAKGTARVFPQDSNRQQPQGLVCEGDEVEIGGERFSVACVEEQSWILDREVESIPSKRDKRSSDGLLKVFLKKSFSRLHRDEILLARRCGRGHVFFEKDQEKQPKVREQKERGLMGKEDELSHFVEAEMKAKPNPKRGKPDLLRESLKRNAQRQKAEKEAKRKAEEEMQRQKAERTQRKKAVIEKSESLRRTMKTKPMTFEDERLEISHTTKPKQEIKKSGGSKKSFDEMKTESRKRLERFQKQRKNFEEFAERKYDIAKRSQKWDRVPPMDQFSNSEAVHWKIT